MRGWKPIEFGELAFVCKQRNVGNGMWCYYVGILESDAKPCCPKVCPVWKFLGRRAKQMKVKITSHNRAKPK